VSAPQDDQARFLGLEATGDASRWTLALEPRHLNPLGSLYGGTGIAAALWAAEAFTGQPPLWVTTRFLDTARAGEVVDLEVSVDAAGSRTSQFSVRGRRGGEPVFDALGACGVGHEAGTTAQWETMPEVPAPADLPVVPPFVEVEGSFLDTLERRLAFGSLPLPGTGPADARIGLWTRVVGTDPTTPAMLGWLADCMPLGVASALGRIPFGTSLDNTLRLGGRSSSSWVLADIRPSVSSRGYAHGDVLLWAEDGTLLATGSQTAIIKPPPQG
jgi:acyl-CoA thioesterase